MDNFSFSLFSRVPLSKGLFGAKTIGAKNHLMKTCARKSGTADMLTPVVPVR